VKRAKRVYQLHRVRLGYSNDILAESIQFLVGLRLARATAKHDDAVAIAVFPLFLLKVDVASLVYHVIRVRWRNVPKAPRFAALVDKVNRNASNIAHVLHGRNHYRLADVGLLNFDKFHCIISAIYDKKRLMHVILYISRQECLDTALSDEPLSDEHRLAIQGWKARKDQLHKQQKSVTDVNDEAEKVNLLSLSKRKSSLK
jgi:hypothetical protein